MSEKKSNFPKNLHMGVGERHISIFKAVIEKSLWQNLDVYVVISSITELNGHIEKIFSFAILKIH